jgi:stearoyl-CoA desaturase (delta-9 desaturase)
VFKDKRNWVPFFSWAATFSLSIPLLIFFANYFTWPLFFLGFVYSMVALGTHGTIYLHRYSTHRAFKFRNPMWRFICRNLVVKLVLEELYVVSHHVHHHHWK